MSHAWLGAVAPGSQPPRAQATGTAIVLEDGQHDAMIEDVIIFSGQVRHERTSYILPSYFLLPTSYYLLPTPYFGLGEKRAYFLYPTFLLPTSFQQEYRNPIYIL